MWVGLLTPWNEPSAVTLEVKNGRNVLTKAIEGENSSLVLPLQKSDRFGIVGAIDLMLRQRQEGVLSSKGKWGGCGSGGGGGERDHINIEGVVSVCKCATFWRLKKGFRKESVLPRFLQDGMVEKQSCSRFRQLRGGYLERCCRDPQNLRTDGGMGDVRSPRALTVKNLLKEKELAVFP